MKKGLEDGSDPEDASEGEVRPYLGMQNYVPKPCPPLLRPIDNFFKVYERGSTFLTEIKAGCVLFMTSAYILLLNPLILSGNSSSFPTGMPAGDIAFATSLATGIGTTIMGVVANYPWVVSTQLGTNNYFVNTVLQLRQPCGAHSTFQGPAGPNFHQPCECLIDNTGQTIPISPPASDPVWTSKEYACQGTKIPFEQALACTFLEGLVFMLICFLGLREYILKIVPRSVLIAGSAGIGVFISFVGMRDSGFIVAAPYPTLVGLNTEWPYTPDGKHSGFGFNACRMYLDGPPFSVVCPWLSVGGLIFTAILMVWDVSGAFIAGIFFTMFISWIKFSNKLFDPTDPTNPPSSEAGLIPRKVAGVPKFEATAGAIDFHWGDNTGTLVGAFFMFLYLDFIGSSITFVAMGEMMGLIDEEGNIPRSNMAFLSDGTATMVGGLLGSSALTTYVESASAVKEGGRTGLTALVCACFFFASIFLSPLFGQIPSIATGPILILIGVLIFMTSINDINWHDMTEAMPAYATILTMPFTNNIAYGVVCGLFVYVVIKFASFKLFNFQANWPFAKLYRKRAAQADRGLFCPVPGYNVNRVGEKAVLPWEPIWWDPSLATVLKRYVFKTEPRTNPALSTPSSDSYTNKDDSARYRGPATAEA